MRGRLVDYVVASHVIEHSPDLVTWLNEIYSILKPSGSLRLAIPDRRYTFDYLRPESRIYDVLDAYIRRARAPLPRVILENHLLSCEVDVVEAWNGPLDSRTLRRYNSIENGLIAARRALQDGIYHDTHCWVFTPISLAELFVAMASIDCLKFRCDYFIETPVNTNEFYLSMRPCDDKREVMKSWDDMKCQLINSSTYQHST